MFITIGVFQCVVFPSFIGVIAAWFPKHLRGKATMGFCTCINIGNIAGAQIAAALLKYFQWGWLMILCAVIFVVLSILQVFLLRGDPKKL